jgi:hypothetical protein
MPATARLRRAAAGAGRPWTQAGAMIAVIAA